MPGYEIASRSAALQAASLGMSPVCASFKQAASSSTLRSAESAAHMQSKAFRGLRARLQQQQASIRSALLCSSDR